MTTEAEPNDSGTNDAGPNDTGQAGARLAAPHLTPLVANRAILTLLIAQNVVVAILVLLRLPMGVALILSALATILLYFALFGVAFRELLNSSRFRTLPNLVVALGGLGLGLVAVQGVALFLQSVAPGSGQQLQEYTDQFLTGGGSGFVWLVLGGGVAIPLVEELAFRGFGLTSYERVRPALFAALAISALFAAVHGAPAQAIAILPLSWILARSVQYSGSFWTGFIIHAINNTLTFFLAGSALANRSQLTETLSGTPERVSLVIGVTGLFVAALSLAVATRWLQPKKVIQPLSSGPVWSGSLLTVLIIAVLSAVSVLFLPQLQDLAQHLRQLSLPSQ